MKISLTKIKNKVSNSHCHSLTAVRP